MNALALRVGASIPVALVREPADLSTSASSTAQTALRMCSHIRRDFRSPAVVAAARQIAAALPSRDALSPEARAAAIWLWVKSHLRFVSDEARIANLFGETDQLELLTSPAVMLSLRDPQGDCDCFTMTVCALALNFGLTPHIVCICCDPRDRGRYSHVFPEVELANGQTLALDASHGKYPGWRVPANHTYRATAYGMDGRAVYDRRGSSNGMDGRGRPSTKVDKGLGDAALTGGCVTAGTCVENLGVIAQVATPAGPFALVNAFAWPSNLIDKVAPNFLPAPHDMIDGPRIAVNVGAWGLLAALVLGGAK